MQKQLFAYALQNRNFAKFRKTPVLESLFNRSIRLEGLQHRCFPMDFAKFLRTPFSFLTEHLQTTVSVTVFLLYIYTAVISLWHAIII